MTDRVDRYRSRRNRSRLRQLFMAEWDPIGVRDEYDGYVARAYVMLMDDHATADQIADYLYWVEREHMLLPGRIDCCRRVARMMVDLRPAFEAESDEPY
jgi:hypothetical protein